MSAALCFNYLQISQIFGKINSHNSDMGVVHWGKRRVCVFLFRGETEQRELLQYGEASRSEVGNSQHAQKEVMGNTPAPGYLDI